MNRNSLSQLQSDRLRGVVNLAYKKVPFYYNLYRKAGITPADVVDVNAIWKLPLVNKDQLLAVSLEERTTRGTDVSRCRVCSTSGSTGKTLTVLEDATSAAFRDALNLRLLWAYGVRSSPLLKNEESQGFIQRESEADGKKDTRGNSIIPGTGPAVKGRLMW